MKKLRSALTALVLAGTLSAFAQTGGSLCYSISVQEYANEAGSLNDNVGKTCGDAGLQAVESLSGQLDGIPGTGAVMLANPDKPVVDRGASECPDKGLGVMPAV